MAHDPFRATRRPRATVAAETAQDAFSGPPGSPPSDPPGGPSGAQGGEPDDGVAAALRSMDALSTVLDPPAQALSDALDKALTDDPALGQPLPPVPESAYPPGAVPLATEPQKPGYPCRLDSCGQVLASPGALGGHMAAHRRRGELD